jgi:feruloyl-CoA synthase
LLGVPVAGLEVKLVSLGDKWEARYRGANVTKGYWRNPEATVQAFDEEGFYKTGDAVKFWTKIILIKD